MGYEPRRAANLGDCIGIRQALVYLEKALAALGKAGAQSAYKATEQAVKECKADLEAAERQA